MDSLGFRYFCEEILKMGTTEHDKKEKPPGQQWKLLDVISFAMMAALVILFLLIFTSLGDSLAAAGQRELEAATRADPNSSGELCLNPHIANCFAIQVDMNICCGEASHFGRDSSILCLTNARSWEKISSCISRFSLAMIFSTHVYHHRAIGIEM